jgi:hypothetical protein
MRLNFHVGPAAKASVLFATPEAIARRPGRQRWTEALNASAVS